MTPKSEVGRSPTSAEVSQTCASKRNQRSAKRLGASSAFTQVSESAIDEPERSASLGESDSTESTRKRVDSAAVLPVGSTAATTSKIKLVLSG